MRTSFSKTPVIQFQQDLLDYWYLKAEHRAMPNRKDIHPADLKRCLPNISILEVMENSDYKFRLSGTILRQVFGVDMRGKMIGSIEGLLNTNAWGHSLSEVKKGDVIFGSCSETELLTHYWARFPLSSTSEDRHLILCQDVLINHLNFSNKTEYNISLFTNGPQSVISSIKPRNTRFAA